MIITMIIDHKDLICILHSAMYLYSCPSYCNGSFASKTRRIEIYSSVSKIQRLRHSTMQLEMSTSTQFQSRMISNTKVLHESNNLFSKVFGSLWNDDGIKSVNYFQFRFNDSIHSVKREISIKLFAAKHQREP